jgi:hypothetical protein
MPGALSIRRHEFGDTALQLAIGRRRDQDGGAMEFTAPTVANGEVYAGSKNSLTVSGLLPSRILLESCS